LVSEVIDLMKNVDVTSEYHKQLIALMKKFKPKIEKVEPEDAEMQIIEPALNE
jgi:hypothetical protein